MGVGLAVMFFGFFGIDVPSTIITAGGFLKTGITIEWPAKKELLQTIATQVAQVPFLQRQFKLVSTTFALGQLCMGY